MPLIKSTKKSAFKKNVETEMHAHPGNRAQDLAIAYSVQRKAKGKKKMAEGGEPRGVNQQGYQAEEGQSTAGKALTTGGYNKAKEIHRGTMRELKNMPKPKLAEGGEISAKTEKRPMPDEMYDDSKQANQVNTKSEAPPSFQTEKRPMPKKGLNTTPIKYPKMVPSDSFSTRLRDEEDELQRSASPGPYGEQPPKADNEEGANRPGPKVPDMEDEHSTHRKPYAKGGEIEASDEAVHPKNKYEDDLIDLPPSEDEGAEMARHQDEEYQRQTSGNPDHSEPHSDDLDTAMYAEGGNIDEEDAIEHAASIAAAIMAKRKMAKEDGMSGSTDMDAAENYALGGEITEDRPDSIKSHGSMDTHEAADQADLSRNADEDANEEDQQSFHALEKENYNETEGLQQLDNPNDSDQHGDQREEDEENEHDAPLAAKIRAKMKQRSPMTR